MQPRKSSPEKIYGDTTARSKTCADGGDNNGRMRNKPHGGATMTVNGIQAAGAALEKATHRI